MKIEFEFEVEEAVVLLTILNKAVLEETNPNVKKILKEMIDEIQSDSPISHFIFEVIKDKFLKNYLTHSEIHPVSDMLHGLGISEHFLKDPTGLTKMANEILEETVRKFKPSTDISALKRISNADIKKCTKIIELMNLIEKSYDKA